MKLTRVVFPKAIQDKRIVHHLSLVIHGLVGGDAGWGGVVVQCYRLASS